ncbi:MAG: hypothetical protein RUMPE_00051 [Eubacteriales bacterium SKADARSKE-1]|nr:hypothetical protein [Eubacteriales bacterium SKADARSKE-1]
MKKILNDKELKLVAGGDLFRGENGAYVLFGVDDGGCDRFMDMGHNFFRAVKWDWMLFKKQYQKSGIFSVQELEKHYNYGNFK